MFLDLQEEILKIVPKDQMDAYKAPDSNSSTKETIRIT